MRHLSPQQHSAALDGVLVGIALDAVRRHLAMCAKCRARHDALRDRDARLAELLNDRPDEAWFEDRMLVIEAQIEAEAGGKPAAASPAPAPVAAAPPPVAALAPPAPPVAAPPPTSAPAAEAASALGSVVPVPATAHLPLQPRRSIAAPPPARRAQAGPLVAGLMGGTVAGTLVILMAFGPNPSRGTRTGAKPVNAPAAATGAAVSSTAPEVGAAPPEVETAPPIAPEPAASPTPAPPRPRGVAKPAPAKPESLVPSHPATVVPERRVVASAPVEVLRPAQGTPVVAEDDWPLLCGVVTGADGAPVVGARVELADLALVARTDRRGRFCVAAPPGPHALVVSAEGRPEHRQGVVAAESAPELTVVLGSAQ